MNSHGLLLSCLISFSLSLPAFAKWDAETQGKYNERAKVRLMEAHAKMVKAVEVSVYLLGQEVEEAEKADKVRRFSLQPGARGEPILDERVLKGAELQMLQKAWRVLADQEHYMQMVCHFPIYGLRFRDAKRRVLFQATLCWACSNYHVWTKDGSYHAAFPMNHLPESDLVKLLNGRFKQSSE